MRLRFTVLALLLTALTAGAVPAVGSAAPRHNRGLTINAIPHSITAGDPVTVYGRLKGGSAGQLIRLYQHVVGVRGYVLVAKTLTMDSRGHYQFKVTDASSNRSWFTRGPDGTHSRTVFERVAAELKAPTPSDSTPDTNHPVVFTGSILPDIHHGERILLQQQIGSSDDWRTLKVGHTDQSSNYSIEYRFRVPGERDLRVVFPGDRRNAKGVSDTTSITVEQAQVNGFTIKTTDPIITFGQQATISGTLAGATPSVMVEICSRTLTDRRFNCVDPTPTGGGGAYSFTVSPTQNTLYQVRTVLPPRRHTAVLFEGVRDIVTMNPPSSKNPKVGETVTFTGDVTPDKRGHVIYLQRQGNDGDWHTVEVGFVRHDSTYQFSWTFGAPGTQVFRARITSDERNVGAASPPVTLNVTPAPVSALPPAS